MRQTPYHTIGKVSEELAVPRWQLAYLIERGEVPGPSLQVPGRRLFTDEDVEKIRAALATRTPRPRGRRPSRS
jgi:DNA-binding transcriptional MerR regulator